MLVCETLTAKIAECAPTLQAREPLRPVEIVLVLGDQRQVGQQGGIKAAANAGDADARALHAGVQQRPRHAFAPGILHRPRLRHPVVAGLLVRNNDWLAAVARQNHCGVVEASEKAAIRARAARLLK